MTPVLEVRGLDIDYGVGADAVRAVHSVDLTLHRGEVLGLAGESGSGKSTLAYGLLRLLNPPGVIRGGSVTYHPPGGAPVDVLGLSTAGLRALRWAEVAIVFQGAMNSLNPVHTVAAQLTDVIAAHRPASSTAVSAVASTAVSAVASTAVSTVASTAARRARARELLGLVGISADRLDAYPHQLSGGMRQRVMIAMALALEPAVVIMDEPTTALDVVMQRQILAQLAGLRARIGFSVLFITHDLSLLAEFADRIAIMYGGRIVETAPAATLYREALHPYSLGLLRSFPALYGPRRELTGIPGSPPDLRAMPTGCTFHPRCPHAFDPCAVTPPALTARPDGRAVACWLHSSSA